MRGLGCPGYFWPPTGNLEAHLLSLVSLQLTYCHRGVFHSAPSTISRVFSGPECAPGLVLWLLSLPAAGWVVEGEWDQHSRASVALS